MVGPPADRHKPHEDVSPTRSADRSWAHTGRVVEDVHRRAAPRRRWTLPVLGLGVALLFGFVGTHPYSVEAPQTAAPTPEETFGDGLPRVTGARTTGPEGLRLLVSGAYPQVLDAHSGRGSAVPGLRISRDEDARLQRVPAGLVATVGTPSTVRRRTVLLPAA